MALVGNPNCGKTTLFNALTGSNQYVGNWPGVTVEKKEGLATVDGREVTIVDLPGIYSLSPYSMEEIVARDFVVGEHPDAIINIVDATNIERNLYLTAQLLELERPMVVALNFMDEVEKPGDKLDVATGSPLPGGAGGAHHRPDGGKRPEASAGGPSADAHGVHGGTGRSCTTSSPIDSPRGGELIHDRAYAAGPPRPLGIHQAH